MATQEHNTVAFVLYPGLTLLDLVGPLHRHGPGPGRPPHRRADRPDGPAGDRVRPPPTVRGIDWDQVNRDIYEPVLGPMVQQQLADRPEPLAKLSG